MPIYYRGKVNSSKVRLQRFFLFSFSFLWVEKRREGSSLVRGSHPDGRQRDIDDVTTHGTKDELPCGFQTNHEKRRFFPFSHPRNGHRLFLFFSPRVDHSEAPRQCISIFFFSSRSSTAVRVSVPNQPPRPRPVPY